MTTKLVHVIPYLEQRETAFMGGLGYTIAPDGCRHRYS
jgi:hypothetical protein